MCLGKIDIELELLLILKGSNEDVALFLVDREGNPIQAKLFLRIIEESTSAVAGSALEQAQTSSAKLPQLLISKAPDALSTVSDLVTSFSSLMTKFEPLIKIGDEVAKIHPYVNFTWKVLSAGTKVN
ncbi:hypothetical protein AX14_004593 [Amanita brunnescens Koide BX004]|nr:hypothetical protein AX14_004593 [Amanita brunnescens Koide BX004]